MEDYPFSNWTTFYTAMGECYTSEFILKNIQIMLSWEVILMLKL